MSLNSELSFVSLAKEGKTTTKLMKSVSGIQLLLNCIKFLWI